MSLTIGPGIGASSPYRMRGSENFPDPFADAASMAMPTSPSDALKWCEYLFMANGTYREAMRRVTSYFITDIEINSDESSREEKEKFKDFLHDVLDIQTVLHTVATDYVCYGNSFTSVRVPFRRYLSCPSCHLELPLRKVYNTPEFNFRWDNYQFNASCPHCDHNGVWNHVDRRGGEESDISIHRWSPHDIEILNDPLTGDCAYIWKIPEDYRRMIREGKLFHLERANWEVIQTIKSGSNKLLFDPNVVYHMKDQALAGARNKGWGISKVITNFRQAWYVQVLHRYNEAIALDYVIPFRVITPMPRPGGGGVSPEAQDPLLAANMGGFTSMVNRMIRARRRDPARWNVIPFPIQYQALGGEATQLAPKDLLDQGINQMLNAAGVPQDLYYGTLSLQAAPPALRLFESIWSPLIHNLNGFMADVVEKVADLLNWEPVNAKLQRVTHADDLNRQMAKLQLMASRQISQTTGLQSVGMHFEEEQKRMLDEEKFIADETQKMQEEMQAQQEMMGMAAQQQAGGAPPAGGGGDPAAGGGGGAAGAFGAAQPNQPDVPTTPQELLGQAQQIAQQIMGMPEAQKDSELIQLKKSDATLHSLVKSQMEDMRQQAQTAGGAQVLAQQFGKQGASDRIQVFSPDQMIEFLEKNGYVVHPKQPPKPPRPLMRGISLHTSGYKPRKLS